MAKLKEQKTVDLYKYLISNIVNQLGRDLYFTMDPYRIIGNSTEQLRVVLWQNIESKIK